jgi:hypothetical protein
MTFIGGIEIPTAVAYVFGYICGAKTTGPIGK